MPETISCIPLVCRAPKDTAVALLRELNDLDRIHLVLALQAGSKEAVLRQAQTQYVDDLIKRFKHSTNKQHNKLTRCVARDMQPTRSLLAACL
jgi:hypothetical protein